MCTGQVTNGKRDALSSMFHGTALVDFKTTAVKDTMGAAKTMCPTWGRVVPAKVPKYTAATVPKENPTTTTWACRVHT
jgi:hypothetical protein